MITRPTMFIGSSAEGKEMASYLQAALQEHCDADVWDQGIFEPTGEVLDGLLGAVDRYDFAALVLSADDLVDRRGQSTLAARDNVLFEAGIFLGGLGRERVFLLSSRQSRPSLPSDLFGVTLVSYAERSPRNQRAEIGPAALAIQERIRFVGPRSTCHEVSRGFARDPLRFAADLVAGFRDGSAGIAMQLDDEPSQNRWWKNAMGMLAQLFSGRAEDVYAAWLRPGGSGEILQLWLSTYLPVGYVHHPFRLDEGLAGKVWARGVAGLHSRENPNEWWAYREGCENQTYVCSVVGSAGGRGGVLGVGSNTGFSTKDGDLEIVQLFASILDASLATEKRDTERALLKQRATILDGSLSSYQVSRRATTHEMELHNTIVDVARVLLANDPIISRINFALPENERYSRPYHPSR